MNPLLQQFIQEARDLLQEIGTHLLELERQPDSVALIAELFRKVHTLKGNSGLFEFPEMTRVLHAGEDLMDAVRERQVRYSQALADHLLDAMDFVSLLIDEVENTGQTDPCHTQHSDELARNLRKLMPVADPVENPLPAGSDPADIALPDLADLPESVRIAAWQRAEAGRFLFLIGYRPATDCFSRARIPSIRLATSRSCSGARPIPMKPGLRWPNWIATVASLIFTH